MLGGGGVLEWVKGSRGGARGGVKTILTICLGKLTYFVSTTSRVCTVGVGVGLADQMPAIWITNISVM